MHTERQVEVKSLSSTLKGIPSLAKTDGLSTVESLARESLVHVRIISFVLSF